MAIKKEKIYPAASGGVSRATLKASTGSHQTILAVSYDAIIQGSWNINVTVPQFLGGVLSNSTAADGDGISYKDVIAAGTYTFMLWGTKFLTGGKVDLKLDSNVIATFDTYANPKQSNIRFIETGVVVTASGLKTVALVINGKNASSAGYKLEFGYIAYWRTA